MFTLFIIYIPLSKSPKLNLVRFVSRGNVGNNPAPIQEYRTMQNIRVVTTCAIPMIYYEIKLNIIISFKFLSLSSLNDTKVFILIVEYRIRHQFASSLRCYISNRFMNR